LENATVELDWLAIAVGLGAAALFITGLVTDRMPNAVIEPEGASNPIGFWTLGIVYALVSADGLYRAVVGWP
jgi:hypothetical protein